MQKMPSLGIIQYSTSSFAFAIMIARKDGSSQLCTVYQCTHQQTDVLFPYPTPFIENVIGEADEFKISHADICKRFCQISLKEIASSTQASLPPLISSSVTDFHLARRIFQSSFKVNDEPCFGAAAAVFSNVCWRCLFLYYNRGRTCFAYGKGASSVGRCRVESHWEEKRVVEKSSCLSGSCFWWLHEDNKTGIWHISWKVLDNAVCTHLSFLGWCWSLTEEFLIISAQLHSTNFSIISLFAVYISLLKLN